MSSSDKPRVLVCMDSFKGSIKSVDVCAAVERAVLTSYPEARVTCLPMADGGEATAEIMMQAMGGQWIPKTVTGPLPDLEVDAGFAWMPETSTALIELASASGLPLVPVAQRNPMRTTTYGTGELMKAAVEHGATRLLLAVGGSATNDAGMGCAQALGWRFLDPEGKDLEQGGGALATLARVVAPENIALPPMDVLCDVSNPFTGPRGASAVFGPQKGATPEQVIQLDANLKHVAEVWRQQLHIDIEQLPGSGAAGGIAGGAVALFGARLVSGVDTMMDYLGVDEQMQSADWLITGEGSFDEQSLHGKVISGLCRRAREHGVKVAVIAGRVAVEPEVYQAEGVVQALASKPPAMSLEQAMLLGAELVERAALNLKLEL